MVRLSGEDPARSRSDNASNRQPCYDGCFDPEFECVQDPSTFLDIFQDLEDENHNSHVAISSNSSSSSSVTGAIFNFTNCIVGAGAIGLGGAMAASGGILSIATIIVVAFMVQASLDLVISLSLHVASSTATGVVAPSVTYEDVGMAAFGKNGQRLVLISKYVYAFGCLVAYTVVLHDNMGPALRNLLYFTHGTSSSCRHDFICWLADWIFHHDIWFTWLVSAMFVLPLCLLRDMTPLTGLSAVSIMAMITIVGIIIYMWYIDIGNEFNPYSTNSTDASFVNTDAGSDYFDSVVSGVQASGQSTTGSTFDERWLEVRWLGFLNNMGTFVFSFVCHHTVHLAYGSLKPELRNLSTWRIVSASSVAMACVISLAVGIFCYMTFWEKTESDIFKIYPNSVLIDLAKILLCLTMVLTFPMPFFTCRELLVVLFFPTSTEVQSDANETDVEPTYGALEEPLLPNGADIDEANEANENVASNTPSDTPADPAMYALETTNLQRSDSSDSVSRSMDLSVLSARAMEAMNSLVVLPGQPGQLKLPYHISLTCKLWFAVTALAIAAPNLGDVLSLVGCASGTLIAFVLPGLFAIQLQGYSHTAATILVFGGIVGTVGTICSMTKFTQDYLASL